MAGSIRPDWIAVDWGTSNLRAWAMDGRDAVIAARESEDGMGRLAKDGFEPALLNLVQDWLTEGQTTDIIACGMVGARQGWQEAAYRAVPCTPAGSGALVVSDTDTRVRVSILPGLRQDRPADVMRGEETQIAGYLAQNPGFDGVICLPGTHSKWAQISSGQVVSFSTYMSGEMFALLSHQSVLRHGVAQEGWDAETFISALTETFDAPTQAVSALFGIRAEGLLHGLSPEAARAKLSGIVLGLELAATRIQWEAAPVVIIGAKGLGGRYADALKALGGKGEGADGDAMTLAGLVSAYRHIQGERN